MECQNRSDKYIWSPHDAYFYKGLSELIVDIDRLIYLSLEKIRKDFVFINLSTDSLSEFINRDNEWLSAVKGKQVVLIAARKSEALANYWYYNSNIRGVVGSDSNLLIVFYVQIMPDDLVMQLHRF